MKIKNLKRTAVILWTSAFMIVLLLFTNLVSWSAIQNEKQIGNLFEHATTVYANDPTSAVDEVSRGLTAAFNEGTITTNNVENMVNIYINGGGNYTALMNDCLPLMIANGWVSSSFSVGSETSTSTQTSEQTSSAPSNTTEVASNESSESTDTDTEEVSVAESSIDTTETSKATDEDENSDANNEWVESERVESTCTEAGYVVYTNASGEEKTEDLPLAEHQYTETSRTAATCTETGSINYTCEVCGDTYSEEIPTIDHLLEEESVEAGLFTSGSKITKCSICGEVISEESIPAKCPIWIAIVTIIAIVGIVGAIAFAVKKKMPK